MLLTSRDGAAEEEEERRRIQDPPLPR